MGKIIKTGFIAIFIILAFANFYIFVSGIKLAEKINFYEKETKKLHSQNIDLEQNVYGINSFNKMASEAAELGYTKKAEPTYFDKLKYALYN